MIGNAYVVRGGAHENRRYLVFGNSAEEAWERSGRLKNPTTARIRADIEYSEFNDLYSEAVRRGWKQGRGWGGDNHDEWLYGR
ncbi:hypothetical protein MUG78_16810 [Gordonia alkaliphila]|uniref:hypothetical protein n=1 Tax=Gordonia alkaliphila TaxID=1053547 RepID=UPI001FF60F66|nr:hypothetical protein [Gordonia alkaliphila]MCK0441062.1 hypothetical protein [Gordonia alkaliphila]